MNRIQIVYAVAAIGMLVGSVGFAWWLRADAKKEGIIGAADDAAVTIVIMGVGCAGLLALTAVLS